MYIEVRNESEQPVLVIVSSITTVVRNIIKDPGKEANAKITLISGEPIHTKETITEIKAMLEALQP